MNTISKTESASGIPRSIGIILDGNRRWAKEQGMPSLMGHKKGAEKIKEVCSWAREAGVEEIILYVFSNENWKRSEEEVKYMMELFVEFFDFQVQELVKEDTRVLFIGDRTRLPEDVQSRIVDIEARTKDGKRGTIVFALSYGGRQEILSAVNALVAEAREGGITAEIDEITEEKFSTALWTKGLLDPDLIIRTGGEKRLSNFLPWQSVYSELFFIDTKWPAFTKEEFQAILTEFSQRERRHGR